MTKKTLLLLDGSYVAYALISRALNKWEKQYQALDTIQLLPAEDTDQNHLPNLIEESKYYRKCLYQAVEDKLSSLSYIVNEVTGQTYPGGDFIDTVIAKDSKLTGNFRFGIYPEYKLTRRIARATKSQFDMGPIFDELYRTIFPDVLPANTYQVGVVGAEGDDVVACLIKSPELTRLYDNVVLIASDRDFVQLQARYPVKQYTLMGERVVPRIKLGKTVEPITPEQALLIKILSGDKSDNIPPIKARIGEITAYKLITEKKDKLKELMLEATVQDQYKLNKQLIDFENIPEDLHKKIIVEFLKTKMMVDEDSASDGSHDK